MFFVRNTHSKHANEKVKVKPWGRNNRQIEIKEKLLYLH